MPITAVPVNIPSREDPVNFEPYANAWHGAWPALQAQLNALETNVNNREAAATQAAAVASAASVAASAAQALAQAATNYKGVWTTLAAQPLAQRAIAIPASVFHRDSLWMLVSSVADVATAEPAVSPLWVAFDGNANLPAEPPSLSFDWENNPRPDSRLVITGGAGCTVTNKLGLRVASAAPRFDHDAYGTPLGLRCAPGSANYIGRSQDFSSSSWVTMACVKTPAATMGLSGAQDAAFLAPAADGVSIPRSLRWGFTTTDQGDWCVSIHVGIETQVSGGVALMLRDGSGTQHVRAQFDLNAVTAGIVQASGSWGIGQSTIEPARFGFYRISVSGTVNTAITSLFLELYLMGYQNAPDTAGSIKVDGAMANKGLLPADYIPTAGAAVTSTQDRFVFTAAAVADGFNGNGFAGEPEGTILVAVTVRNVTSPSFQELMALSDGTSDNRVRLAINNGAPNYQINSAGMVVASINGPALPAGRNLIAISWRKNRVILSINGSSITPDLDASMPAGMNAFSLGAHPTGASPAVATFGLLRVYRKGLTQDQIMALCRTIAGATPRLLGSGQNQAPTNAMLGGLAYQSASTPRVGELSADSLRLVETTNGAAGVATLVAGTAVVANTRVTSTSRIRLDPQNASGTAGTLTVSARVAGTSFTVLSSSNTDTRQIAWQIWEPAT